MGAASNLRVTEARQRSLPDSPHRSRGIAAIGLLLLVAAAYHNSFSGAFVFDDIPAIKDNATIRSLWPISGPLSPPENSGVGGRPLANLSFALNYALGGTDVRGFHAGNLLLHLGATLLLFGIVRRTLRLIAARDERSSTGIAFAAAAVWCVHPLTTASVTYLSQRTELLMAVFYLVTLYSFIRAMTERRVGWGCVSVGACALGMMSKEVMVTAPVLVLLYDRTFVAGGFRAAWQQRWRFYLGLAATWLVLAWVLATDLAQRSVGFGLGVSALDYILTEARAILIYVRLALLPQPLVFDYGAIYSSSIALMGVWIVLLGVIVLAVKRGSRVGFLAAGFFLLLAPTSSFVPVAEQPIAENRMYLPLAPLVVLGMTGLWAVVYRAAGDRRAGVILAFALLALGALTIHRNADYRTELKLWADTVSKRPANARANYNCGVTLLDRGQAAEAMKYFESAIRLKPLEPKSHNSRGNALLELGRAEEALMSFAAAVRLQPNYARAWYNYGLAFFRRGDVGAAIERYERALRLDPQMAEAYNALGNAHFQQDRPAQAVTQYEAALRIDPSLADAHYSCGSACLELGRIEDAVAHFTAAAKLKSNDAEIRNNLGAALLRAGRVADSVTEFERALKLKPGYDDAKSNLEVARRELGRVK